MSICRGFVVLWDVALDHWTLVLSNNCTMFQWNWTSLMIRRWNINKNKCFESEVVFTLPFNRASVVNVTFKYIPIRLRLLWIIHLCLFTPSVGVTPTGRLTVTNHPSVFRLSFLPHSVTASIVTAVATRVFVINSSCVVVRPGYFKW